MFQPYTARVLDDRREEAQGGVGDDVDVGLVVPADEAVHPRPVHVRHLGKNVYRYVKCTYVSICNVYSMLQTNVIYM